MIFAAGFGTRMGALTADCPKPLIKVSGMALIDHALGLVQPCKIKTTVVNTHYLPDMISSHLAGKDIIISHEPDILETGGGLRNALPLLGSEPVFTMNTDAVWTGQNPLLTLAASWDAKNMDALLLLVEPEHAHGHSGKGDFNISVDGTLKRGHNLIYSGAQIIKTSMLDEFQQDSFSLNLLWDKMISTSRVFGTVHNGKWCDVGTAGGITIAEQMLKGNDV